MAVVLASKNHSPYAFTTVPAASGLCNAICMRPFWQPISIQNIFSPRVPSMSFPPEGAEARLRAAHERVQQRANEGQCLPRSFGCARAGARRPSSPSQPTQESAYLLTRGRLEAWKDGLEPPLLEHGELSDKDIEES